MRFPPARTSPQDRVFLKDALEGGMAEVQLGQLALQKSNNADVKQFAQKMVDDHTKMGDQLKPIAQQIGVKIPDGPSKKDKATIAKLQELNGDDFDKAYMKDMVKDHKDDLNDFRSEADQGSNPAVKMLPIRDRRIISQHCRWPSRSIRRPARWHRTAARSSRPTLRQRRSSESIAERVPARAPSLHVCARLLHSSNEYNRPDASQFAHLASAFALLLLFAAAPFLRAERVQDLPQPTNYVSDFAGVLSPQTVQA